MTSKSQEQALERSSPNIYSSNDGHRDTAHSLTSPDVCGGKQHVNSSDQHSNDFTFQAEDEHEWDIIVDACFSGSELPFEAGTGPQDWIFDFDSPVPTLGSKDRRLNVNTYKGCYTCRLRRKKCDEGSPACMACKHFGLRCEYKRPLWWPNNEQRRIQEDKIKMIIQRKNLNKKPTYSAQTTSTETPPGFSHSLPTTASALERRRSASIDSQLSFSEDNAESRIPGNRNVSTFYGTIGSNDFTPWCIDAATPPFAGPRGGIPDCENPLPLNSTPRIDDLESQNPSSAEQTTTGVDTTWINVSDPDERRRIQNRIAQRKYR